MLSNKLSSIAITLQAIGETETQREAAIDFHEALQARARREACLRCEKSGWLVAFDSTSKDPSKHAWGLTLASCSAYQTLPQDPDGIGLITPNGTYFCTEESTEPPEPAEQGGFQ